MSYSTNYFEPKMKCWLGGHLQPSSPTPPAPGWVKHGVAYTSPENLQQTCGQPGPVTQYPPSQKALPNGQPQSSKPSFVERKEQREESSNRMSWEVFSAKHNEVGL